MIKFIGEKYQIMRRLAQTNNSEVYLGRDLTVEGATLVAIKVFRFHQDNNMVENLLNSNPETENIIYIDDEDDYIDNICPNCKKTLNPDVKFCSNCGQKLV